MARVISSNSSVRIDGACWVVGDDKATDTILNRGFENVVLY